MDKENLIKILNDLKEVRTKTLTKVNDNILWDTAIRIYNSESISNGKKNFNSTEKASKEQLDLLYKLDLDIDAEKITKKEAQDLISKTLKERKEKKK